MILSVCELLSYVMQLLSVCLELLFITIVFRYCALTIVPNVRSQKV